LDEQTGPEPQSAAETQPLADASREPYRGEVVPPAPKGTAEPARGGAGRRGGWTVGMIVIIIGVIFLGKNAGWFGTDWGFHNWWALFILIPTIGSFAGAWRSYSANGRRLGGDVARTFMTGLLLLAVTIIFLLELDWGKVWPVLLVIVGIGLLLGWKRR
jgi:hypothetical protein